MDVELDTQDQIRVGVRRLEQQRTSIKSLRFIAQNEWNGRGVVDDVVATPQQNFVKFWEAIFNKQSTQIILPSLKGFQFDGKVVIGLDEAVILAKFVTTSEYNYNYMELTFTCQVSTEAFQYLISNCGSKIIHRRYGRKPKTQNKWFAISGPGINYPHVKSLDQVLMPSSIGSLILHRTNIGDNGVIVLADILGNNTSLITLDLYDNNISSLGAQALGNMLCHNSFLQTIKLSSNQIGNEGVQAIAESLWVNSTLEILYLSNVGCYKAGIFSLANALCRNKALKMLDLSFNYIKESDFDSIKALGESLKTNSTLSKLSLFRSFPWGINTTDLAQSLANSFAGKSTEFELVLSSNKFRNDAMNGFANCSSPHLNLDLGNTSIQPHNIIAFAQGIQLGRFDVQALNLNISDPDDQSIKELLQALVDKKSSCSLTRLSLEYVTGITIEGAQYIVDKIPFTSLQHLYLTKMVIGDKAVQQIAAYLNDSSLTRLGLDGVGMEDPGLIELSKSLRNNTKLTTLDVYGNSSITAIGTQSLLETVRDHNITLEVIVCIDVGGDNTLCQQIRFYVALNRTMNGKFHNSHLVPVAMFADILENHCDRPAIIYWVLRSFPHFFLMCH